MNHFQNSALYVQVTEWTLSPSHVRLSLRLVMCWRQGLLPVAAPRLWDNLPLHIHNAPSVATFKTLLKTNLFTGVYSV